MARSTSSGGSSGTSRRTFGPTAGTLLPGPEQGGGVAGPVHCVVRPARGAGVPPAPRAVPQGGGQGVPPADRLRRPGGQRGVAGGDARRGGQAGGGGEAEEACE